jgi:hypothetical protein
MNAQEIASLARHRFHQSHDAQTDSLVEDWLAEKIENYRKEKRIITLEKLKDIIEKYSEEFDKI